MNKAVWQQGIPGIKWGIWNQGRKEFQFGIEEETPMLAHARLCQIIGEDAGRRRFDVRQLPKRPRGHGISDGEWISAEKKPDPYETVDLAILGANGFGEPTYYTTIGCFEQGKWKAYTGPILSSEVVTHWKPRPEPPAIQISSRK